MSREMTHTVTAERSSINDIMQAAIKWEKGNGAYTYYAKTKASRNAQTSASTSNDNRNKNNLSSKQETHNINRRPRSPKRLQIVDQRRYTVKEHSVPRQEFMRPLRRPKTPDHAPGQGPRTQPYGVCWDCGKSGHYRGDPVCKAKGKSNERVFRMVDKDGNSQSVRLFKMSAEEYAADESYKLEPEIHQQDVWDRYDQSPQNDEAASEQGDQWGGSQYESDPIDDNYTGDEQLGMMRAHSPTPSDDGDIVVYPEQFGAMNTHSDSDSICSIHSLDELESMAASDDVETLEFQEFLHSMQPTDDGGFKAMKEPAKKHSPRTGN
ncbi:hypothetical protein GYMLUDRAFT_253411 [Collybiopsis luxurians FD-317 M1]|uniref:Uncharacterized protein n=1 Tax=Collybiopsis luxurians FD-317 M1 TaxID=944289 RepID=A0A0D0C5C4_9AGAR|nr:hypothetical protein GYMLUDRAFT_253411 [Collybiopsis luxurians FD-317 M1]